MIERFSILYRSGDRRIYSSYSSAYPVPPVTTPSLSAPTLGEGVGAAPASTHLLGCKISCIIANFFQSISPSFLSQKFPTPPLLLPVSLLPSCTTSAVLHSRNKVRERQCSPVINSYRFALGSNLGLIFNCDMSSSFAFLSNSRFSQVIVM